MKDKFLYEVVKKVKNKFKNKIIGESNEIY